MTHQIGKSDAFFVVRGYGCTRVWLYEGMVVRGYNSAEINMQLRVRFLQHVPRGR